jgi:hypothetical protein
MGDLLDNFEQKQNENDEEDEADASAAVVAETRSHAITTEAEHKNQDDQKNKHYSFSPCGEDSPDVWCDAYFVTNAIQLAFFIRLPGWVRSSAGRDAPSPRGYFGRKGPIFIGLRIGCVCKIFITKGLPAKYCITKGYELVMVCGRLSPLLWDHLFKE